VTSLTPLQQKVALVAITVFSLFVFWFLFGGYFKRTKGKVKETHTQANQSQRAKKSCAARLADNRKDAEAQQAFELSKGFSLQPNGPLMTDIIGINSQQERDALGGKRVGLASCQGQRPTMEDQDLAIYSLFSIKDEKYFFDLFGVFDGHGGTAASAYVRDNILVYLTKALEDNNKEVLTEEGIFNALKECFKRLDADYKGSDGTTATVALILEGHIWVANVGDSRTILVTEDKIVQASEDAKPSMKRYAKKIEKLGGFVLADRVNSTLATARAIGDKDILGKKGECCVSPHPKITCYPIKDFMKGYLVLASDGLYDVATTNEVGQAIQEMGRANESTRTMSQRLVSNAIIFAHATDNVSVLVVKLS